MRKNENNLTRLSGIAALQEIDKALGRKQEVNKIN